MNSLQDIDIKETQELNDLEELYTVFYAIKDPGPYAEDKNIKEAVIKWLNRKGMTQQQLYRLLYKQADDATYACILGLLYHHGIGVQVDHSMAFVCYGYAAESSNDAFAQNQMGYCCHAGLGTTKNGEKAFEWFKKSAEGGHIRGMHTLAERYYNGSSCEKNPCKASYWHSKAYNNGNLSSTQRLVHCHRNGDGTPRDPHKALYLAKKDPNIFRSILSGW